MPKTSAYKLLHKSIKTSVAFSVLALLALTTTTIVYAQFSEPTASPPGNNTLSPINVGSNSQVKTGGISVGSFIVNGGSLFGDTITLSDSAYTGDLTIRHTGNNIFSFTNTGIGEFLRVGAGNTFNVVGQQLQSLTRGAYFSNSLGGNALVTNVGNV